MAALGSLTTPGTIATAAGQLTALLGTYLALVQLVLMARSPWLDQAFGLPRLAIWHRWVGFACLWLLVAHAVFTTVGLRPGRPDIDHRRGRDAPDAVPVRPDGHGRPGAPRLRRRHVAPDRTADASRTRPGTTSTCTHTSASPWGSPISSSSGRTSPTTRSRPATGSGCMRRPRSLLVAFRFGPPVQHGAAASAARGERGQRRRPASSRST